MENTLIKKGLTGNQIKMIGVALMFIDHVYQMFVIYGLPSWVDWFGRPVAIIFLFFCAEGFHYTRSRRNYMGLMLGGYLFMYVVSLFLPRLLPLDVVLMNSIFGTLFLSAWLMLAADKLRGKKILAGILLLLAPVATTALAYWMLINAETMFPVIPYVMALPNFLTVEGGFLFPILGLLFYLLRGNKWIQMLPLLAFSVFMAVLGNKEWISIFAAIPLLLYNGKRGGGSKYFFYIFYPAHIYGLYVLSWLYGRMIA